MLGNGPSYLNAGDQKAIVGYGCSNGRGNSAKARALEKLKSKVTGFVLSDESLLDRAGMSSQVSVNVDEMTLSDYFLRGNETCVSGMIQVDLLFDAEDGDSQDFVWDQDNESFIVTVTGEGEAQPEKGVSARANAEKDALQRAMRIAIGEALASDEAMQGYLSGKSDSVKEWLFEQFISANLSGVNQWVTLSRNSVGVNKEEVTLQVEIALRDIDSIEESIAAYIGYPSIFVSSKGESAKLELVKQLSSMDLRLTDNRAEASLIYEVDSRVVSFEGLGQLDLNVTFKDRWGNVYGHWRNTPSLISLPLESDDLTLKLIKVHFGSHTGSVKLRASVIDSLFQMVNVGGPIREVFFNSSELSKSELLPTVLTEIDDLKIIDQRQDKGRSVFRLRFLGSNKALIHSMNVAIEGAYPEDFVAGRVSDGYRISY